jgi:hypothetical protein
VKRLLFAAAILAAADVAFGATYYVDCAAGADAASGTTATTAWRSVAKVSATTFQAGDVVLFRRGTRCTGMLWPKGSGTPASPIRLGAYDRGARPIIEGGREQAAIKLFNQQAWEIENLETTGGEPYGLYIGADAGRLKHFRIRNTVIRDVGGEVRKKASGLVVVLATGSATLEDVVIDGVVARHTTQWAGVIVQGATRTNRVRDVAVRNTIVHDVFGDGIVLFQVENGLVEKSAAWLTGLQPVHTIGTPNGIWTWRCRTCTVQLTEGFFIDSPGVDAGVYDIDWGNDDNIVQHNYGHDAQGYCVSVFGAQKEVTTNSIVRHNLCVNNGRSPKLARRQGDLYVHTWDEGALDGVLIHDNTFYWNPPIDVPAFQIEETTFTGTRPNRIFNNAIHSTVPSPLPSNPQLQMDGNAFRYHPAGQRERGEERRTGRWTLRLHPDTNPGEARSQLVFVEAALAQYDESRLDGVVVRSQAKAWQHDADGFADWPLERARGVDEKPARDGVLLALMSPSGSIAQEWRSFVAPAELGLALRLLLGAPRGSPSMVP